MTGSSDDIKFDQRFLPDFFERALSGFVITDATGRIVKVNETISHWIGCPVSQLLNKRALDLFSIGGQIYYETHLFPLLKIQGFFEEVALDLSCSGQHKLPVLVNAILHKDQAGIVQYIWFTIVRAQDRRTYEQNLKDSKTSLELCLANALEVATLRDQFIAVLGHDLRNPLGSVLAGTALLSKLVLDDTGVKVVGVINRSALRMGELINNIMDFARTRLGEGIIVNRQPTKMQPVLQHVVDELKTIYPDRQIDVLFNMVDTIVCDGARIAQLTSNLLANAITHGSEHTPVLLTAESFPNGEFVLKVTNQGVPIAAGHIEKIFEPFTRESQRPSRNGIGLGLYIASQIAKAHKGELTATSTNKETQFTLRLYKAV